MKKNNSATTTINIYCGSICRDEGEITQISGCGILCYFTDQYGRISSRSFGYGLNDSNSLDSSTMAACLGLSSIKSQYRNNHTVLHVDKQAIVDMLNSGTISDNETYNKLRDWYNYYKSIDVKLIDDVAINQRIKNMAEIAMVGQENSDSGTMFHE